MRNYTNSGGHRFILRPYTGRGSRAICPYCSQKDCFSHYIDTTTGEIINDSVGRCNREDKCSAHYTPADYFKDNPQERGRFFDNETEYNTYNDNRPKYKPQPKPQPEQPTDYIDAAIFERTLTSYDRNNFYQFLVNRFGEEIAEAKAQEYRLGTSKKWDKECVIYWQIDNENKIRTGKIMLVNPVTGKRVKQPFTYVTWVHSVLNIEGYNLKQCLYGLHLLNQPGNENKTVCIVESEKTAIISSIYMPQFIWMATGAKLHLNEDLFAPLKGREVVFYPDLGAYGEWVTRTEKLRHIISVTIDDTLQQIATADEINEGLDIADYLLRQDYKQLQLRQQFINDILKLEQDSPENHRAIITRYLREGLQKDEAQKAINILFDKHGFENTAA